MNTTTLTGAILAAAPDHARPMLTYYNESTGERTELSGATLGNWAAKIGNFLRDGVGLIAGDQVRVDLPEHWQTAAILLGSWWAGAQVLIGDADGDARVVFTSRDRIDAHDEDEVVVVPLDPFAMGVRDLPIGLSDFGESIRAHGDRFVPSGAGDLAVDDVSVQDVVTAVAGDVTAGDRIISVLPWRTAAEVVANFAAPLVAGASLVYVDGPADDARLDKTAATEKATVTWR
ncbi:TIGR03089 family protein [Gordonia phthalatica]|uniref:Acetyl-CoA synthetase n=1 Tax=Gordonia phthalatica TaxID=1136941 RepID=A0A0N9NF77_9ACTN|nr:TIGR03089 family protein [Gordonia phthalatica]ALG84278.1 acetyl-CoA synthetase [Gordonia phthalatica]